MSDRFVCIHGHFYQPPRENPWLEEVEREASAHPFHDWNERITHEAYAPNAFSRILDGQGRIDRIVNNYGRMSFNFGPTLLAWLERKAPQTYRAVLAADAESMARFSGHGSALAQAYNHMILPLATSRDRWTQIVWGIRDFEHRFGRAPEGMWLPETAVDVETLEMLAAAGIRFTILAPHQAEAVREDGGEWRAVDETSLDSSRPYRIPLPSGQSVAAYFYDGGLSRAVAFERLLTDGAAFARRLAGASAEHPEGGLTHLATDGETYGHHHRHGEMALSFALEEIEGLPGIRLTNYGEHLARRPPSADVRIREHSSWSCVHGTERWRRDCGCSTGAHPGWSQAWREPLRDALDRLRDHLEPLYESAMGELVDDPWGARDRYVEVVLDRSPESVERFLLREASRPLRNGEPTRVLELLELQRHAMLMYTSCGWFFDDVGGIESLQVLKYAARALHLAKILFGEVPEEAFLERLADARSNHPEAPSGRDLYEAKVRPLEVTLGKVAAHHAVSTLFEPPEGAVRTVYCYSVEARDSDERRSGRVRLAVGRLEVASRITLSREAFSYAVLHMGDHQLVGGVRPFQGEEAFRSLMDGLLSSFDGGDLTRVIRTLDQEFHAPTYSLRSLFHDEQERIVSRIISSSLADAEGTLGKLYEDRRPLMRFLAELGIPQPLPFRTAGEFVLNTRLERALAAPDPDLANAERLLEEGRASGLEPNEEILDYAVSEAFHRVVRRMGAEAPDAAALEAAVRVARITKALPFEPDLWWPQNAWFHLRERAYPGFLDAAARGDDDAVRWVETFREVGEALNVAVPEGMPEGVA